MENIVKEMLFRDVDVIVAYIYKELENKYLEGIKRTIDSDPELHDFYENLFCIKDKCNFSKHQMIDLLKIDERIIASLEESDISSCQNNSLEKDIDSDISDEKHENPIRLVMVNPPWGNDFSSCFVPKTYKPFYGGEERIIPERIDNQDVIVMQAKLDQGLKPKQESGQQHGYLTPESSLKR